MQKNNKLTAAFSQITPSVSNILEAQHEFLEIEDNFLHGNVDKEELDKFFTFYKTFNSTIPLEQMTTVLNKIDIDSSLKRKIVEQIRHVWDVRNTWVFCAVFVELFGLTYNGYMAITGQGKFGFTPRDLYLLYYLVIVFLVVLKLPNLLTVGLYDSWVKRLPKGVVKKALGGDNL